ncbi:short neuropeptide F-like protein, partial [Dinothrombium tinctorium]
MLMRNEGLSSRSGSRYSHQLERKGGRAPSLRLRFGRRADPSLAARKPSPDGIDYNS